jgi:hypothetical protein
MSAELDHLKRKVAIQQQAYDACDPGALGWLQRTLAEAWLSEVGLLLERLQRDVVQLESENPSRNGLQQAWGRYLQVFSALGPISTSMRQDEPGDAGPDGATAGLRSVARRLLMVLVFLGLQIIGAVLLLLFTLSLFSTFNPQTALTGEQLDARSLVRSHVTRIERVVDTEAQRVVAEPPASPAATVPAPTNQSPSVPHEDPPNVAAVRGEIEGLAASLEELRLATRDATSINLWLQSALVSIDSDPPDFASAKSNLASLAELLVVSADNAPPSLFTLTVLGSLLGMITITVHLNWKFRNRWDTVGFLPWYLTKLIGAPVLSIAAIGFMSQFTFTKNLNEASGFSNLGLRGADPLLIFSVAILTGLFSNRVFEWLKEIAQGAANGKPGGAPSQTETAEQSEASQK